MLMALILPVSLFAAEVEPSTGSEFVIDLGTFTGIVTLVSSLVTQILKVIPAIKDNKLAKIGISALVGILVCLIAWGLQLTPLLENYPFYQVLIYGLAAGLSGCGFYDVIKAIGGLFKNKEELSKKERKRKRRGWGTLIGLILVLIQLIVSGLLLFLSLIHI